MANIPYNAAQGEDLYDGTINFNAMDSAYDPATPSPYLMEARDAAQFRDFAQYVRGADVIGNAKKVLGISIATDAAANLDVLQYSSSTGKWESQAISLGSIPSITLAGQSTPPAHAEGLFYYDSVQHAFVMYLDESDVAQTVGQETFARVYNNTGVDIANGSVVYIDGAFSGRPKIALAKANAFMTSRFIGLATHSIEKGTYGYVTVLGIVNGLNTNAFNAGDVVYLSPTTAGTITATKPSGENYVCEVGTVLVKSATVGSVYVNPVISELAFEMTRHKGFPANAKTESTISFVDATRTFSITPIGVHVHFYQEGVKYIKTAAEDLVVANTTGSHFIHYVDGVLTDLVNGTVDQIDNIILNYPAVAYVYWNATAGYATTGLLDERHHTQTTDGFTPADHLYTHTHEGGRYRSGMAPASVGTGGDGSLPAHAQFGVSTGTFDDEDLTNIADAVLSTAGLTYLYKSGTAGDWVKGTNAGYSFPVGATPLAQYNQFTGSTWHLTEITSGNFMLIHLFAKNGSDEANNYITIVGQNQYASLATAQTAALTDISNFNRTSLPFVEFCPVATFIIEGKTSYTNAMNARLVVVASGASYQDFRTSAAAVGSGGGTTAPGGTNTAVQYNSGGTFAGSADFTFNSTAAGMTVTNMTCGGVSIFSNATITGGSIDGPTIGATTEATINHDALQHYDANDHVDHTGVTITAGVGLSGGGTIASNRTIDLDITELSAESSIDAAADYVAVYDTSASAHKKVLVGNIQSGFANPMTTAGDIIIGGGSGAATRLAVGTVGKVLKSSGSAPVWSTDSIESNPNVLINTNGLTIINQEGNTTVANGAYGFDMWKVYHNLTTATVSQESTGARITATTKGAGDTLEMYELIENYISYRGKTLTLSAKVKSNRAFFLRIVGNVSGGTTVSHSGGGAFEVLSVSHTVSASDTELRASMFCNAISADGNYVEFEWIKLEEGSIATPYAIPRYDIDLIGCQRMFCIVDSSQGIAANTTVAQMVIKFPVQMRYVPQFSLGGTAFSITNSYAANFSQSSPDITEVGASTSSARFNLGNFTGLTAGDSLMSYPGAGGYIIASARL